MASDFDEILQWMSLVCFLWREQEREREMEERQSHSWTFVGAWEEEKERRVCQGKSKSACTCGKGDGQADLRKSWVVVVYFLTGCVLLVFLCTVMHWCVQSFLASLSLSQLKKWCLNSLWEDTICWFSFAGKVIWVIVHALLSNAREVISPCSMSETEVWKQKRTSSETVQASRAATTGNIILCINDMNLIPLTMIDIQPATGVPVELMCQHPGNMSLNKHKWKIIWGVRICISGNNDSKSLFCLLHIMLLLDCIWEIMFLKIVLEDCLLSTVVPASFKLELCCHFVFATCPGIWIMQIFLHCREKQGFFSRFFWKPRTARKKTPFSVVRKITKKIWRKLQNLFVPLQKTWTRNFNSHSHVSAERITSFVTSNEPYVLKSVERSKIRFVCTPILHKDAFAESRVGAACLDCASEWSNGKREEVCRGSYEISYIPVAFNLIITKSCFLMNKAEELPDEVEKSSALRMKKLIKLQEVRPVADLWWINAGANTGAIKPKKWWGSCSSKVSVKHAFSLKRMKEGFTK